MDTKRDLPVGIEAEKKIILDYIYSSQKIDPYSILANLPTVG